MASLRRRSNSCRAPISPRDLDADFGDVSPHSRPTPQASKSFMNSALTHSPKVFLHGCGGLRATPMASSHLHPLTAVERQAVAEQIHREVTTSVAEILHAEMHQEAQLKSVHLKSVSLVIVAVVALGACMVYLRVVLVPFLLALFFTFLLEPLLFALLNPPAIMEQVCPRARAIGRLATRIEEVRVGSDVLAASAAAPVSSRPRHEVRASSGFNGALPQDGFESRDDLPVPECRSMLESAVSKSWALIAVTCCIVVLLGVISSVIYGTVQAIASVSWEKYENSHRLQLVLRWFPHMGSEPADLDPERLVPWLLEGPIFNALDWTLSIISQGFLTLLFLGFLLVTDAASAHTMSVETIGGKIRASVRRYIRIKTVMALIVSCVCGLMYWYWAVDLFFVFSLLTFILYYIPHVGNTIAILCPLPLIFLDPTKTALDFVFLFAAPFVVHQLATNLVDPKWLAKSLDLHPIIVLLSLAFWTTLWGPMGAILSVPLTAVVRLVLLEIDHPYTQPIVLLLQGDVKEISSPRRAASLDSVGTPRGRSISFALDEMHLQPTGVATERDAATPQACFPSTSSAVHVSPRTTEQACKAPVDDGSKVCAQTYPPPTSSRCELLLRNLFDCGSLRPFHCPGG